MRDDDFGSQLSILLVMVMTCVVHVIRASTCFVPWKDRKRLCADLRTIYIAGSAEEAELALEVFEERWDDYYPAVARGWRSRWEDIVPFLAYPAEMRRAIYTTNAIEALNLRKALKNREQMPSGEAALKLLYRSMHHDPESNIRYVCGWPKAIDQLAIFFEGRLPQ